MQQPENKLRTLEIVVGSIAKSPNATECFSKTAIDYLSALSAEIRQQPAAKQRPDVMAFAFWCRKSNLLKQKERFTDDFCRLGLGTAFHIAPSNVPINAFYSFAFGLLAGNANIVRLPSKSDDGADLVLGCIQKLFSSSEHKTTASQNAFVRYNPAGPETDSLSVMCDIRVIWGGDTTITEVRHSPMPSRSRELAFADRYSFSVLDAETVENTTDKELERLAVAFFNDTMQMDQNACSSPHLIAWLNGEKKHEAKKRFWAAFEAYTTGRYQLEPVQSVDRYTRLLSGFVENHDQKLVTHPSAPIQRVSLSRLPVDVDKLRGIYGLFYEYDATELSELVHIVNKKYQTLTYFGVTKQSLRDFVVNNSLLGIDRIVPVGEALNIDLIWDGHNVLHEMTRIIDVR